MINLFKKKIGHFFPSIKCLHLFKNTALGDFATYCKTHENRDKILDLLGFLVLIACVYLQLALWQHPYITDDEGINFSLGAGKAMQPDSGFSWLAFVHLLIAFVDPKNYKFYTMLLGVLAAVPVFLVLRAQTSRGTAYLFSGLMLISSVYLNESHRLRPEIVHVFLAMLSFGFLVWSLLLPKRGRVSWWRVAAFPVLEWRLALGFLCMLAVPNTHIIGGTVVPGLALLFVVATYRRFPDWRQLLCCITAGLFVAVAILYLTQPQVFDPVFIKSLHEQMTFEHPSTIILKKEGMFFGTLSIYFNWVNFYVGTLFSFQPIENKLEWYLSNGQNRIVEFFWLNVSFLFFVATYIILGTVRKSWNIRHFLAAVCFVNVLCFVLSIPILQRATVYYLIIPVPWLFLGLGLAFSPVLDTLKRYLGQFGVFVAWTAVPGILLFLSLWNAVVYLWDYRHSNWWQGNDMLNQAFADLKCKELPVISEPYNTLYMSFTPIKTSEAISAINTYFVKKSMTLAQYTSAMGEFCERVKRPDSCLVMSGWHYNHMYYFKDFKGGIELLRSQLDSHSDKRVVEFPFYRNDPMYPKSCLHEKECGWMGDYPVGVISLGAGGREQLHVFKPRESEKADLLAQLCPGSNQQKP